MAEQRRLLVFGGTGFLGSRLCTLGLADDWSVHATHLTTEVDEGSPADWHRCDITMPDAVCAVVSAAKPTHIVNAAYRQSGDDVHAVCSIAAETMALAAADIGARFVHLSTDLVFDGELGRPYLETDETRPLGAYGEAKVDAERRVAEALPSAAIARTSLIYGDPSAPQERLVRRAHDDGDIAFFTDEWRSPIHVDDLATSVMALLDDSHAGLLHVAGRQRLNRLEFARLLAASLDLDPDKLVGRTQDPALGPRAKDVSLDTTRSQTLGHVAPGPTERLTSGDS